MRSADIKMRITVGWVALVWTASLAAQSSTAKDSTNGGEVSPPPLPKGVSAWSYAYEDGVAGRIKDFNAHAKAEQQFRYFFPYAGSLGFHPEKREVTMHYRPEKCSDRYAQTLPAGTLIVPNIDARADKKQFSDWTDAQYETAAVKVAEAIGGDPRAAGVQIDIEPFAESHLPFYRHLRRELNARGKFTTMYVGPKNAELLSKIFQSCDVVVISGYDMDTENTGVEKFRKLLTNAMVRVQRAAANTHGKFMVGIPAAASWGEYEYSVDEGGRNRVETGNKQEDYVRAALAVLREYEGSPEYLGVALWKLSTVRDADEPEKATKRTRFPDYIRPSVWGILGEYLGR